jgi:hypothetical protein
LQTAAGKSSKAKDSSKSGNKKSDKPETATTLKVVPSGADWEATEPIPKRQKSGVLIFPDFPDFQPNRTPKEVLQVKVVPGSLRVDGWEETNPSNNIRQHL